MKIITSQEDFDKLKSRGLIQLECECCKIIFTKTKHVVKLAMKQTGTYRCRFCSNFCQHQTRKLELITVNCKQCNISFTKKPIQIQEKRNNFCDHSCRATYQNTHKIKGYRRSKLEAWLEQELIILYPNLEFHFNRKDAIISELDIYIPSLKLAFELNGIFHYEPIYGQDKLNQIQNNDSRKFQACLEKGIELCIIDSSKLSYFKPEKAKVYLDIIMNVINQKMVAVTGVSPA